MKLRDPKLWLALLSFAAVCVVVLLETSDVSPGELTPTHARVEALGGAAGCATCHGEVGGDLARGCASCHREIAASVEQGSGLHGRLEPELAARCGHCHREHHGDVTELVDARAFELAGVPDRARFAHDFADFRLSGVHARLGCERCHALADAHELQPGQRRFLGLEQRCGACHEDPHRGQFVASCDSCHGQEHPFKELANFVHTSELPLTGGHAGLACARCHAPDSAYSVETLGSAAAKPAARACGVCHESPHDSGFLDGVAQRIRSSPAASCSTCHSSVTFAVATSAMPRAHHVASGFDLGGPHSDVACAACHADYGSPADFKARYPGRSADDCGACHVDPHAGQFDDERGTPPSCLACHTREAFDPHRFDTALHARTAFPLDGAHVRAACDQCHTRDAGSARKFRGTERRCESCHADVHGDLFGAETLADLLLDDSRGACAACHGTTSFAEPVERFGAFEHHVATRFPLDGSHERAACETCHVRSAQPDAAGRTFGRIAEVFGTPVGECATCHDDVHRGAFDRAELPRAVGELTTCARCHDEQRFDVLRSPFDHAAWTAFELDGAHARAECAACHGRDDDARARRSLGFVADHYPGPSKECSTCHDDVHAGAFDDRSELQTVDGRAGCARCHDSGAFRLAERESFDHGLWTDFALTGRHAAVACEACHVPERERDERGRRFGRAAGASCSACHSDPHLGQFQEQRCESCHSSTQSFSELVFDHTRDTRFALDVEHARLACAACHRRESTGDGRSAVRYRPLGVECRDCHGFEKRGGR